MNTVIRLSGRGGELDKIVLDGTDLDATVISQAVILLASSCDLAAGDTITITEED
jgi:hypothetical protein